MSDLKPCPFCGGKPLAPKASSGSDERCGYNFTVVVECGSCGVTVTTSSKQDKGGWCVESPQDAMARAIELWQRRTQPEATKPAQDLGAAILAMNRAKLLPIWDNDVPHKLHVELDVIFKALAALASPAQALSAVDSETVKDAAEKIKEILYGLQRYENDCGDMMEHKTGDWVRYWDIHPIIFAPEGEAVAAILQSQGAKNG